LFMRFAQEIQITRAKIYSKLNEKNITKESIIESMSELKNMHNEIYEKSALAIKDILLPNKTTIAFKIKSKEKNKKISTLNAKIRFIGDKPKGDFSQMMNGFKKDIFDIVTLDANMSIEKSLLRRDDEIDAYVKKLIKQGLVSLNSDKYESKILYSPNSLLVNEKNMTPVLKIYKLLKSSAEHKNKTLPTK